MPRVIKNNKGKRRNHKPIVTCVPGVSEERGGEAERDLGGSSREGALKTESNVYVLHLRRSRRMLGK